MGHPTMMDRKQEATGAMRPCASRLFPWYDSQWLTRYVEAKAIIRAARPEAVESFVSAFGILWTRPDFEARLFERLFDDATLARIRRAVSSLRPDELELHEARRFGRYVVHGHPLFTELQRSLEPLVGEAVGEPVEASYSFLSLYGAMGVCPVHIDAPIAKWTLDLCVDQTRPWPIHYSRVLHWPDLECGDWRGDWEESVRRAPENRFTAHSMHPGEALVFSGSSQWHYRDALPDAKARDHCDLLFFHFIPKGAGELACPANWARLFGMPELAALS